jgi:hypothetical protein
MIRVMRDVLPTLPDLQYSRPTQKMRSGSKLQHHLAMIQLALPSPSGYNRGMDDKSKKLERSNRVLGRLLIVCLMTPIFAELTCLVPAGRSPEPEISIAWIVVLYGIALIAVCRGVFDFMLDMF